MAEVTDILCEEETGDIQVMDGDMVIGDATYQHQADILEAHEGIYKESPTVGVGIDNYLNDEDPAEMLRKIRMEFVRDGMRVEKITRGAQLRIIAEYV